MSDEKRRLVITEDDLGNPPPAGVSPPPAAASPPPAVPATTSSPPAVAQPPPAVAHAVALPTVEGIGSVRTEISFSNQRSQSAFLQTVQGRNLVAATAGIVVGWAFCEITGFGLWATTTSTGADIASGAYVGALGLFFAVIYASWEHILARNLEGIKLAARRSALGGAALGFGSGFVAQIVFRHFVLQIFRAATLGDLTSLYSNYKLYLTRALAWGMFGAAMGVAGAAGVRAQSKVLNGLIGGAIGGALGGLVFHWASYNISSGPWSRLVGLLVVGAGIGLAIGTVEKLRRDAWLLVIGGAMTGKEFILYAVRTRVGSSPACEITLIKDPAIQPDHFTIQTTGTDGSQRRTLSANPGATVLVNGQLVSERQLRSGDTVTAGNTTLAYSERASASPPR
jgi:hypothetical protein